MRQAVLSVCMLGVALFTAGCGIAPSAKSAPASPITAVAKMSGTVYGGQQAVTGATIQLYAVGNQANGSPATALLSPVAKSDGSGSFNISGLWNCNDTATYGSDPLLYIVATGGNPGLASGTTNGALALMSALGRCSTVTANTSLIVNEVTTVASVYALAPFMTDITHVGAADTAALARAFATVRTLADPATGMSPGPDAPAGATVPVQTLYSLADAMATCINSDGGQSCDAFFAVTQVSGGPRAVDTVGAMLQVAHAPSNNVTGLFNLIATQPPFQPTSATPPADWTISVRYTGGGLSGPSSVALDAEGNAWIANASGAGITELSNQGLRLTGDTGYSGGGSIFGAQAIALDKSGNAWVADTLLSTVVKLTTANGTIQQADSFSTNDIDGPIAIAVDSQNHIWVANFTGGSVLELTSAGQPIGAGALTAGGTLQAPAGVAIDASGNVWITDNGAGDVVKFDTNQNLLSGAGFSDQAMVAPTGIAIDTQGSAWITDSGLAAVSRLSASGVASANFPISGGGLAMPNAAAIDGSGIAWVTSASGMGLTRISPNGTGIALGSLNAATGVAVDPAGNVWVADGGDDSVTKFIGLAVPVATPIAVGVGP